MGSVPPLALVSSLSSSSSGLNYRLRRHHRNHRHHSTHPRDSQGKYITEGTGFMLSLELGYGASTQSSVF